MSQKYDQNVYKRSCAGENFKEITTNKVEIIN